jgi:sulfonate transport system permease protein
MTTDATLVLEQLESHVRPNAPAAIDNLVEPHPKTDDRRGRAWSSPVLAAILPAVVLGLWWLATGVHWVAPQLLVSPWHFIMTFGNLFRTQDLIGQIGISLARAGLGLLIGGGAGLILGTIVGLYRRGEDLLDASMQMLRTVPFLAVVPLFILWLGIGETPKVLIIALATMFPMYLNTSNGVRNVDRRVVEAMRSFDLDGARLTRHVIIPLALPQILTGLRFSMGVSVLALIAAEQINAKSGIGYLLYQAQSYEEVNVLLACLFIYCAFGLLADLIVRVIEHFTMPWRAGVAAR